MKRVKLRLFMMIYLIVLCLQIVSIHMAPLQVQQLHQMPMLQMQQQIMQASQQVSLQQQLLALQQLQALQKLNTIHSPLAMTIPQPLQMILLPQAPLPTRDITEKNEHFKQADNINAQGNEEQHTQQENGYEDKDLDSIVVDTETNIQDSEPPRAIIVGPNGRWIIGDFISSIPWLPFEVNVPDSIAWAYNGISSIISIIGQRLPFRPQTKDSKEQSLLMKQLMNKQTMPILVLPLNGMMLPMQM